MRFWSIILDKLIFPLGVKLASNYVEQEYITPQKRFQKREAELDSHERKALELVRSVGFRPASTKAGTDQALSEITLAISRLLSHDINADSRKFGINFLSHYTDEMTLGSLMVALRRIDPRTLASIVSSVVDELLENPATRLISTRDALGGILQSTENQCRSAFDAGELLQNYLVHRDLAEYESRLLLDERIQYGGIDCPISQNSDAFAQMRRVQEEMEAVGRHTARQKCSRTHIVMSVALGNEWVINPNSEDKYLVITAQKTDKTAILVPSQTPVVTKRNGAWIFYGDSSAKPSSELLSHWTMHEQICAGPDKWHKFRGIFHAHLVELIELSRKYIEKTKIPLEDQVIPNIDWAPHGTAELGEKIVRSMFEQDCTLAIVKHHGPWFVCEKLEQGLDDALNIVEKV